MAGQILDYRLGIARGRLLHRRGGGFGGDGRTAVDGVGHEAGEREDAEYAEAVLWIHDGSFGLGRRGGARGW